MVRSSNSFAFHVDYFFSFDPEGRSALPSKNSDLKTVILLLAWMGRGTRPSFVQFFCWMYSIYWENTLARHFGNGFLLFSSSILMVIFYSQRILIKHIRSCFFCRFSYQELTRSTLDYDFVENREKLWGDCCLELL